MPRKRDEEAAIRREARFFMADASETEARAADAAGKRARAAQRSPASPRPSRITAEQRAAGNTIQCPECFKIRYPPGRPNPGHLVMGSHGYCVECERKAYQQMARDKGLSVREYKRRAGEAKARLDREKSEREKSHRERGKRR